MKRCRSRRRWPGRLIYLSPLRSDTTQFIVAIQRQQGDFRIEMDTYRFRCESYISIPSSSAVRLSACISRESRDVRYSSSYRFTIQPSTMRKLAHGVACISGEHGKDYEATRTQSLLSRFFAIFQGSTTFLSICFIDSSVDQRCICVRDIALEEIYGWARNFLFNIPHYERG